MKTKISISTILLLISLVISASASTPTFTFYGLKDKLIEIPVKLEEPADSIPGEIARAFYETMKKERKDLVNKQFDISGLSKPEAEVDEAVPFIWYHGNCWVHIR